MRFSPSSFDAFSCYLNPNWIETLKFGIFLSLFSLALKHLSLIYNTFKVGVVVGVVVAVVVIAQNQNEEKKKKKKKKEEKRKRIRARDRERVEKEF